MTSVVLLLGGECTGKTALADAIAARFHDRAVRIVPEVLRSFTDHNARPPRQDEQHHIWSEQSRLLRLAIDDTNDSGANGLVICDPAPLMTAVYNLQYFQDESLLPDAISDIDAQAVVVWCAPDIPWQADGVHRDGPKFRERTHELLADRIVPILPTEPAILVSGPLDERLARLGPYLA